MEAECPFNMLVTPYKITCCHNPYDHNLNLNILGVYRTIIIEFVVLFFSSNFFFSETLIYQLAFFEVLPVPFIPSGITLPHYR
jgi:hypothetical protein